MPLCMCPDTTHVKKQKGDLYYVSPCSAKHTHDTSEHKCRCGQMGHSWLGIYINLYKIYIGLNQIIENIMGNHYILNG